MGLKFDDSDDIIFIIINYIFIAECDSEGILKIGQRLIRVISHENLVADVSGPLCIDLCSSVCMRQRGARQVS